MKCNKCDFELNQGVLVRPIRGTDNHREHWNLVAFKCPKCDAVLGVSENNAKLQRQVNEILELLKAN